jgi:predicted dehydrogenase
MRQIRWGILGVAAIATQRTIPAMAEAPSALAAALASRDLGRARAAADRLGVDKAYGDYQALLDDPDIDAVYIPLPNSQHVEWSLRALEAGKHVLCEKPLALRSEEVLKLIQVRDRAGRRIEEAFSFRNHPQWDRVDEIVEAGSIGRVTALHGTIAKRFLDPADIRNSSELGGGALYDLGAYVLAACNRVFGRPPDRVTASMAFDPDYGIDGLTTCLLDYGDAHACFTASSRGGTDAWATHQMFSLLGSEGWLRADFPYAQARPTACSLSIGRLDSFGDFPTETVSFPPVNQYAAQVERFSRLLLGEPVRAWPIEDALLTLRMIEALFESARSGEWRRVGPS